MKTRSQTENDVSVSKGFLYGGINKVRKLETLFGFDLKLNLDRKVKTSFTKETDDFNCVSLYTPLFVDTRRD